MIRLVFGTAAGFVSTMVEIILLLAFFLAAGTDVRDRLIQNARESPAARALIDVGCGEGACCRAAGHCAAVSRRCGDVGHRVDGGAGDRCGRLASGTIETASGEIAFQFGDADRHLCRAEAGDAGIGHAANIVAGIGQENPRPREGAAR